jgi:nitric oxide reductase NorD protein
MADAEDVLIAAAERVAALGRGRSRQPAAAGRARSSALERRVVAWLAALGLPPLVPAPWEAPPAAGRLARVLGRTAPWQRRPRAFAWSDGRRLFLPAEALRGERAEDTDRVLLAALAQGLRVARRRLPDPRRPAIASDVCFMLQAALGDAELASELPGLAPALDAERARALAERPDAERLRPAERVVEALVRRLLAGPARDAAKLVVAHGAARATPTRVEARAAEWCAKLARLPGGYRGVAPVGHWGAPPPFGAIGSRSPRPRPPGSPRGERRPPTRSVSRPMLRRGDPEPGSARPGPFVVPHGDPHLAVQDACGVARPEDRGDEDLDALAEELVRAGALPTVCSPGEVREVLEGGARPARDGATPNAAVRVQEGGAFLYPEWDAKRAAYRDPGIVLRECTLPLPGASRPSPGQAALLARVRRQFEALRPRREQVGRQLDGDDIDVDAIVDEHGERVAGRTPEGRSYACGRPRRRDVAVSLLVDASGSTDGWVSSSERVIDVARQAALCLGEALAALGDRHAILAFSGQGAGDVRVGVAKRFAEPWSETVRARLAGLEPDRSTRLGGPIRHATAGLARQAVRTRVLLVLSDGKPDDDDAYEGDYGLEDVRQAVFEARRAGVRPFCVTIDRTGPAYLPYLFGPSYAVLWNIQQLPERLPAIYRRLAV